jgi:hypothetical protein
MSTSPTSRPLRVFLCYASEDKPAAHDLYLRLSAEGFIDPWLDEKKLLGGQDWDLEIRRALRRSNAVVICLSQRSVSKVGYVNKEIKRALDIADEQPEGTIFIIPLKLDVCETPDRLSGFQWIKFFMPDGYERLIESLRARAHALGII